MVTPVAPLGLEGSSPWRTSFKVARGKQGSTASSTLMCSNKCYGHAASLVWMQQVRLGDIAVSAELGQLSWSLKGLQPQTKTKSACMQQSHVTKKRIGNTIRDTPVVCNRDHNTRRKLQMITLTDSTSTQWWIQGVLKGVLDWAIQLLV